MLYREAETSKRLMSVPKEVTSTDTYESSVKSTDYSFNDDLPSSSPSGKTVLMILGV